MKTSIVPSLRNVVQDEKRTLFRDNFPRLISALFRVHRCSDSAGYVASTRYESVPIINKRCVVKQVGDEH